MSDCLLLPPSLPLGLPGLVAAKCGARVTLTDHAAATMALANCRQCCLANDLPTVTVKGLTWGTFTPALFALAPCDFILGADCLYDPLGM